MNLIENSSLIVGSAPDAGRISDMQIPRSVCLIAVNNAWKLRPDFAIHISPNDFPKENYPPADYPAYKVQNRGYTPGLRRAGGTLFCGATMAFVAGYYALNARPERIITFMGCNMVYDQQKTHFYGKGEPDPIKVQPSTYASIKDLPAKASRMFLTGLLMDTLMINVAPAENSQLTIPTTKLSGNITERYEAIMADQTLQDLIVKAAEVLMKERQFPYNRHALNLAPISKDHHLMRFINMINTEWRAVGQDARAIVDTYLN